jgi:hypothetical protein
VLTSVLSALTGVKAGFVICGPAGGGAMNFHRQIHPLNNGGLRYDFTFGGSLT